MLLNVGVVGDTVGNKVRTFLTLVVIFLFCLLLAPNYIQSFLTFPSNVYLHDGCGPFDPILGKGWTQKLVVTGPCRVSVSVDYFLGGTDGPGVPRRMGAEKWTREPSQSVIDSNRNRDVCQSVVREELADSIWSMTSISSLYCPFREWECKVIYLCVFSVHLFFHSGLTRTTIHELNKGLLSTSQTLFVRSVSRSCFREFDLP